MRSSQNKPELKDIKSRNVQEEGDHGVFRSPQQGVSDDSPPHQFYPRSSKWRLRLASKTSLNSQFNSDLWGQFSLPLKQRFSKYSLDIKLDHDQMKPRTVRHKLKYGWIRDRQKIVTVLFGSGDIFFIAIWGNA